MENDVFNKATKIKEEIERVEEDLKALEWYKHANCRTKHLCREVTTTTRGFIREGSSVDTYWDMELTQEDIEILNHFRQHKKAKLEEEFKHLGGDAQQDELDIIPCPFCGNTNVEVNSYRHGKNKPKWALHHRCKCTLFKEDDVDTWSDDDKGFYFSTSNDFDSREDAIKFWNHQCQLAKENFMQQH